MSAAARAGQAQQSSGKAYGVDSWLDVKLPPMTKVWQGMGGTSDFFLSETDVRTAIGAFIDSDPLQFAESLWRMAQVGPSPTRGYRDGIREYVVDIPCQAAIAVCSANPQFGSGTLVQYFIPDWQRSLFATGREHTFPNRGY